MENLIALVRYHVLGYELLWGIGVGLVVAAVLWQVWARLWDRWDWLVPLAFGLVVVPAIIGAGAERLFDFQASIEALQR